MRTITTLSLAALLVGAAACQEPAPTPSREAPAGETQPAVAKPGAAVKGTPAAQAKGDEEMDGCPGEEDKAAGATETASEEHTGCGEIEQASAGDSHFGKPFALTSREALSAATNRLASASAGETVQVSGTVDSVCKKKGCWMVIKDGDVTARVFTHAGKFFMPVGTNKGRKAVVEGKLKAKTMSEKFAKHLAEDKGEDPSGVTGSTKEWVLNATSAELL